MKRLVLLALAWLFAFQASAQWQEQVHQIPLAHDGGRGMHTLVLRPPGEGRHPVVVINHGSPPNPAQRPFMKPGYRTASEWFLRKGFVVAVPMRRGYGETGGAWAETYGRCGGPNYVDAGIESAKDIASAVDYMAAQAFAEPARVLVVGQSAGGWGSIALASLNPPKVAAIVNFAGGRGGYADNQPNNNCAPERLVSAAQAYGKTARVPMIWIYTENDLFFAPELSRRMFDAFSAGGGRGEYVLLPAFGRDGHSLFGAATGVQHWAPLLEKFLAAQGF